MSEKYLSLLNSDQHRAVTYGIRPRSKKLPRPLLILAGAGTGKTHTIATRITHCIVNGADPDRILLLVFGRDAAQEMSQRATKSLRSAGRRHAQLRWAGTFHSIAARFVRKYAHRVGLQPNFTIIDPSDAATLMASARAKLSLPDNEVCSRVYSAFNNTGNKLAQVLADYDKKLVKDEDALRRLFRRYERAKLAANVADFDDLLKFWLVLLREDRVGDKIRKHFDYVFVDEYQDTNWLQAQILLKLKPDGRGLTVVGDDAQSIYAFRGGRVANILEFPASFSSPAKVLKLEQNYRSTQPILAVCNVVLSGSGSRKVLWSNRKSKRLPTWVDARHGRAQAQYVSESIIRWQKRGGARSDCAVLVREALHSTELEGEFARQGIPFRKYGGPKVLEAPIVRDIVAILRWCDNPRDHLAGSRVLQLLPGIGSVGAHRLLKQLKGKLSGRLLRRMDVPSATRRRWPRFVRLIRLLRSGKLELQSELGHIETWLATLSSTDSFKLAQLSELRRLTDCYSSRSAFLTEAVLDPPELSSDSDDCVTISTMHSAKGREWKKVIVLNAVDGYMPSARAETAESRKEEQRLLHVAVSRARNELEIIAPLLLCKYFRDGNVREVQGLLSPTPFIRKADRLKFSHRKYPKRSASRVVQL